MSDPSPQQEFHQALLNAQREFPTINKGKKATIDTQKGSYSYAYADLGDVMDAVLPILHKHDLALSQPLVSTENGKVGVGTRIYHTSGWVEDFGELTLSAGNTPQSAGSALTYARRYAACAALGIVADEDDDGRAASQPQPEVEGPSPEERLQNRLKAKAAELTEGDVDQAKKLFEDFSPEVWTKENVEWAEKAMELSVNEGPE